MSNEPNTNRFCLRPYDESLCREIVQTKYENLIRAKFGNYIHLNFQRLYEWDNLYPGTPRLRAVSGQVPCATFYYLEFLTNINPEYIFDIGCGMNFFKGIVPKIIGMDGSGDPDIFDHFDENFVHGHREFYQAAFSINALHFIPITSFRQRVLQFYDIIKIGGRGYIAMNAARMIDNTNDNVRLQLFGSTNPDTKLVADYIECEIHNFKFNFLVVENLIDCKFDDAIDGNIRLLFQK